MDDGAMRTWNDETRFANFKSEKAKNKPPR
jgi:hypothetical protein